LTKFSFSWSNSSIVHFCSYLRVGIFLSSSCNWKWHLGQIAFIAFIININRHGNSIYNESFKYCRGGILASIFADNNQSLLLASLFLLLILAESKGTCLWLWNVPVFLAFALSTIFFFCRLDVVHFVFFFSFVVVFVSADLDYFLASMIGLSGTQDMMVSINSILFCICLDQFYFLSKQVPAMNVSLSSLLMELTTSVLIVHYIVLVSPYMAMRRK